MLYHKMTRNKILLIFRFIISAVSIVEGKIQEETLRKYISEIIAANQQRSLILAYKDLDNFEGFSKLFYNVELPTYNVYLGKLKTFNGVYDDTYDIAVTYEESKLYFLFINTLEDIYSDLHLIRKIYFWRDRDKVVVFINGNYSLTELKASFLFCYQFYIVNIVFAFLTDRIEAFSYNPFSKNYSLPMDNPSNLFPDKFQNLHGYKLRISMFPDVLNALKNGTYHGSDGKLSLTIAHQLNATYTYIYPYDPKRAPVLVQYDDVAERVADVGFNTRYIKFNFKNLIEKTYPHDRNDLSCLIPTLGMKKFTGFNSLLSERVWYLSLAVSLFFFVYVMLNVHLKEKKSDVVRIVMLVVAFLLNQPIREKLDFRLALISFLTFSFFLNTLIICRLTSIFTAPAPVVGIQTVKELSESGQEIITIDRFQELLNASLEDDIKRKIFQRLKLISEELYLSEIEKHKNVVFICKEHLANYAVIQKSNYPNQAQFYRIMKERILPTLSCYIVSYGSPFLKRIDNLVKRILESGILNYWKMKTWQELGDHYEFRKNFYKEAFPVAFADIWIGVQIFLFGLVTSSLVFMLELISIKLLHFSKFILLRVKKNK